MGTGFSWVVNVVSDEDINDAVSMEIGLIRSVALEENSIPATYLTLYNIEDKPGEHRQVVHVQPEFRGEHTKQDLYLAYARIGNDLPGTMRALPVMMAHVSEAWYLIKENPGGSSSTLEDFKDEARSFGGISHHPERRECVTIMVQTLDGRVAFAILPFEKKDDGQIRWIEDDVVQSPVAGHLGENTLFESNYTRKFFQGVKASPMARKFGEQDGTR